MALEEVPTTTSYSDPIYDRLETGWQRIRRRWPLAVAALVVLVTGALVFRSFSLSNPKAADALDLLHAMRQDPVERKRELRAFAEDPKRLPYYRARAWIEISQGAIEDGKVDEALAASEEAMKLAALSEDDELPLDARLSKAAALEDAAKHTEAESLYAEVAQQAGNLPTQRLLAQIGQARAMQAQGDKRLAESLTLLDQVLLTTGDGSEALLDSARMMYWLGKRKQDNAVDAAPVEPRKPPTPNAADLLMPPTPQPPTPAAPAVPQPVVPTPPTPGAPQPVTPGAPVPPQPGMAPMAPQPTVPGAPQPGASLPGAPVAPQPVVPTPGR